jgi:hypothetical protein
MLRTCGVFTFLIFLTFSNVVLAGCKPECTLPDVCRYEAAGNKYECNAPNVNDKKKDDGIISAPRYRKDTNNVRKPIDKIPLQRPHF